MNHPKPFTLKNSLPQDLPASIVVFLVALPLCLGIALASGAPLFAGIIAGIVGGIAVGAYSGSPLGVSGPAAGLAVIVFTAIQELGSYQVFLVAVVLAGIFQFILGVLRAGIIGYYFPTSVIKGMLAGIGLIIILKQIPHATGYDADYEGNIAFANPDGYNTFSELSHMLGYISPGAIVITLISLAIMILWEQPFIKKLSMTKWVQGPLVAVITGILLNKIFQTTSLFGLRTDQIVSIPVAGSFSGFIGLFTLPDFSALANPQVYIIAITMAVVASLETLLCVEATDKLDPYKRITPTNRELRAQGFGNVISGMIGGLPITQVIVRSSANIQSGALTKGSAIYHGLLLLVCAVSIPTILNMIPLASLAAILFVVGYKLSKPVLYRQMWKEGYAQFIPFMVTIIGILVTDLLVGIALGMGVAVFYILYKNYKIPYFVRHSDGSPIHIELAEDVTFLNKATILQTLNHLPDDSRVIIDAHRSVHIDHDVRELIEDFRTNAQYRNITLEVIGMENKKPLPNPKADFIERIAPNTKSVKESAFRTVN
ncbi:MAG: SulP family inorganic anion transporter [Saprospiraceae bacterium]|nr:SulP family inorganic anion transporter [Saprospiraceae bacterium]MCB9319391.1 SulP family inorganic anion transporter [Lewinellaceae bacterium]